MTKHDAESQQNMPLVDSGFKNKTELGVLQMAISEAKSFLFGGYPKTAVMLFQKLYLGFGPFRTAHRAEASYV